MNITTKLDGELCRCLADPSREKKADGCIEEALTGSLIPMPIDIWMTICRELSQNDLLAFTRVCRGLLKVANRCWISLAKTYGIDTKKIVFKANCLTVTQKLYDNQQAFSTMPWFLDAFKVWERRDVFASMRPFYAGQKPYAQTHNDKPMYSSKPRSIVELFRMVAESQKVRSFISFPVEAWTIIVRKLPQKDLLAVAGVSRNFLTIVNQCWVSLAKTYGIYASLLGLPPDCLTIIKSVYKDQQALFAETYIMKAFKAGIKGPSTSLRPFYYGQQPCDETLNCLPIYSSKPRSIDELFKLFAAAKRQEGLI